jgi:hypothetical protein
MLRVMAGLDEPEEGAEFVRLRTLYIFEDAWRKVDVPTVRLDSGRGLTNMCLKKRISSLL